MIKFAHKHLYYFGLLFLSFFIIQTAFAQSGGSIYGTIYDASSSTSLPGATVIVKGTNYGTITDPYGKYTLTGVPAGLTTIQFSYVGYNDEFIEMNIEEGDKIKYDISLIMDLVSLSEVVVTAQMLGQTKAINQQLNSDALMNVVSEDKIKDLPDVNAAEAIGRIPGVAIQRKSGEGQKVMIRGLEPKFSAITINGVRMASNSSTDKSVDLSMISPELLAGIEVYKSPTADMDGEAVGGTVNLIIKKAPNKQRANIKLSGGYNSINKSFGNYSISADASKRFFNNRLGVIAQVNSEQIDRSNHLLGTSSKTENNELYYNYFKLSDIDEVRKRLGASLNIDFNLGQGNISLFTFYSKTDRNIFSQSENYSPLEYNDVRYIANERDVDLDIFSTALRGDHNIGKLLIDWSLSTSKTNNNTPYNATMYFRDINAYGNYHTNTNNFEEWISSAEKDYSESRLRESHSSENLVNENFSTAFLNLKLPFSGTDSFSGYFKMGGKYSQLNRERDFNESLEPWYYQGGSYVSDAVSRYPNTINYTSNGLIATNSFFNDYTQVNNTILGGDYPFNVNFNRDYLRDWHNSQKEYYTANRKKDVDDYSVIEKITAGYLMAKLEFGDKLIIIPGIRFEHSDNTYSSKYSALSGLYGEIGTFRDTTTYQQYNDILPNFHITYKPNKWLSIRTSVVKTIARPNYNYVTPRSLIDINSNKIKAGSPELKHMESWNYDLNFAFYNGKYGLFTAGVFYKDMKNIFYAVENLYLASDSIADAMGYSGRKNYYLSSYGNSPDAEVWGLEFDLQTNLKFLPSPFNGVVLSANFSRLFSETQKYWFTTNDTTYRDPVTGIFVTESEVVSKQRKISLPGQVPYILNLSVGYDYKGFSCRVSGVYQGTYLKTPGTQDIENVSSWRFWRWDASAKQKINQYFSVFANLTNFNQQREESYKNEDINSPVRVQEYGMIFNLGVQAKF